MIDLSLPGLPVRRSLTAALAVALLTSLFDMPTAETRPGSGEASGVQEFFSFACSTIGGLPRAAAQDRGDGDRDRESRSRRSRRGSWSGGFSGGSGGFGGPGGFSGGFGGGPSDFMRRLDANGDGMLSPDEIPERMRGFIAGRIREAGGNPDEPISLKALEEMRERRMQEARSTETGESGRDSRSDGGSSGRSDGGNRTATATALVPTFGNDQELFPVPGFGDATVSGAAPSWESEFDRRTIDTARDIIRRYDRNGNGVLEREEWEGVSWRSDPNESDLNRDGRLTLEEMTRRIAASERERREGGDGERRSFGGFGGGGFSGGFGGGFGGGGFGGRGGDSSSGGSSAGSGGPSSGGSPSASSSGSSGSSSSSGSRSKSAAQPKPFQKLRSTAELLPKGLPEWFIRKDLDGDGQVQMAEFATTWSSRELDEFLKYDLNGDGVITAREALAGGANLASSSRAAYAPAGEPNGAAAAASVASGGSAAGASSPSVASAGTGYSGGSGSSYSRGGSRSGSFGSYGSRGPSSGGSSASGSQTGSSSGLAAEASSTAAAPASAASAATEASAHPPAAPAAASSPPPGDVDPRILKRLDDYLARRDVNRNGYLDGDELEGVLGADEADVNKDGRLTREELLRYWTRPR